MFLYFDILTLPPTLSLLGTLLLISLLESLDVFDFTAAVFILIVLWYVSLYLLITSSNLSIYLFFETKVM